MPASLPRRSHHRVVLLDRSRAVTVPSSDPHPCSSSPLSTSGALPTRVPASALSRGGRPRLATPRRRRASTATPARTLPGSPVPDPFFKHGRRPSSLGTSSIGSASLLLEPHNPSASDEPGTNASLELCRGSSRADRPELQSATPLAGFEPRHLPALSSARSGRFPSTLSPRPLPLSSPLPWLCSCSVSSGTRTAVARLASVDRGEG
ncbi:uncharacterized protein LOC119297654 [Triticum dicoccoides]|uniref:uncharacterized protein LOC119297654 n=1 Tax=Triticum dicoccoides TaxID=85692 RepID=UPI00188EAB32|nr:uncharacterized protein LOC119297654 [Triticum dicoccoides]